ncbi:septal ring lytic transglycosylase RlpA family protein [Chlorobium ferrooxidans]|uniref:Probable endolytic peptidoglycan transglycosylase RlpA n=1 Tax=Chlorobium ferrooxidans DSM 13031 TaxID=377431 RepID=Q0YTK1_9CHLB|nr:septal ring lytic transglycosylase RlpA family protein [Chlorobium ferrooxidans]EAT59553.1 rare lipoprotein A [Chlorobium ferrooxidans DSM 13031]
MTKIRRPALRLPFLLIITLIICCPALNTAPLYAAEASELPFENSSSFPQDNCGVTTLIPERALAAEGTASYYSRKFQGRKTASGESFNCSHFTAAHRSLPFGTSVRVINLDNGKHVVVRINDRGPYLKGRIIDVSPAAAREIGLFGNGTANVRIEAWN